MEIQDINLRQVIEDLTGEKFNRDKKIHSPFNVADKTPSFSIYFNSNQNKWMYKDFSTGDVGDGIDFVMKFKNCNYNEARQYLGLEVEKSVTEDFEETIRQFVRNQVTKGNKRGYKPLGVFVFVDTDNKPIYAKVKFLKPDGKKETPYYHIENGQVINNRSHEEVPYNYYNLLEGIAEKKTIIFVEGEKDVNTINNILSKKYYVATSIKGFKDYDKIKSEFMDIVVIGDTGTAGQKYIDNIKYNFLKEAKSFKVINLPNIKALGDNADVTDWLEDGHTKEQLLQAFERSLDLKDKYELQQDKKGIYLLTYKKKDDDFIKEYLTDFNLLEASKVEKVDEETGGIKLKIKSCIDGKTVEKVGSSKIFDDLRSFRNFLGMDFSFMGRSVNELVKLKGWVNKYFAIDNKEIYSGAKFLPVSENLEEGFKLIAADGTLLPNSKDYSTVAESTRVKALDVEPIGKDELKEVMKHIFNFVEFDKAISIIGSVISFLEIGQNIALKEKLHHLLIVGEAETGKSTIVERIIAPLLNYPLEDKQVFSGTPFALQKAISTGNYPIIIDEFKPTMMDKYKVPKLSDIFRIAYDRSPMNRGDKNFELKEFYLTRPLIMCGEESYPGSEKANVTRSCIVYLSKHDRTEESTNSMFWLMDHEDLLKKLGKSILLEALNLPVEEYKLLRADLRRVFKLKDRPLNTAINIACGIELLNKVLMKHDLLPIADYFKFIEQNIREDVLDGGEDAKSTVEQMLSLYNEMLQNNSIHCNPDTIKYGTFATGDQDKVYIRTQLLIDAIFKYIKECDSVDVKPLREKDFKKQAKKAGYITKCSAKQKRIGAYGNCSGTNAWFDEYDRNMLIKLKLDSILNCDDLEEIVSNVENNVINNVFPEV